MKLPEKIKGKHKCRDGAMVILFKKYKQDFPKIAERYGVTERRVRQIVSLNHAFQKRDLEWEKEIRINRLERWITNNPETKKDTADIQEQLRKELEGDKPLINIEGHQHTTYVWQTDSNSIPTAEVPVRDSRLPEQI
jgi:hypothetical protein